MKQAVQKAMRQDAKGIKVILAGRLGGAEIARVEKEVEGSVPLQTLRANIDYGQTEAHTTYRRDRHQGLGLPWRGAARAPARRGLPRGEPTRPPCRPAASAASAPDRGGRAAVAAAASAAARIVAVRAAVARVVARVAPRARLVRPDAGEPAGAGGAARPRAQRQAATARPRARRGRATVPRPSAERRRAGAGPTLPSSAPGDAGARRARGPRAVLFEGSAAKRREQRQLHSAERAATAQPTPATDTEE